MPGPVPGIHVFGARPPRKTWMAATSPAMTKKPASRAAIVGWVMFDWATHPFFTLVTTFVYAPYFAAAVAADPVEGQALWGYAKAAAGLAIAVFSPILG